MKVINITDMPYFLPPQLFGGRKIVVPNDGRVYEIPDYDFRNNSLNGLRIVEYPKIKIEIYKYVEPIKNEQEIIEKLKVEIIKKEEPKVEQEIKVEEVKKEKPLQGKNLSKSVRSKLKKNPQTKNKYGSNKNITTEGNNGENINTSTVS